MSYHLDPRRNLIAQLSRFFAEEGDCYRYSEDDVEGEITDTDQNTFILEDQDQEQNTLSSDLEMVYLRDKLEESVVLTSQDGASGAPYIYKVALPSLQLQYLKHKDTQFRILQQNLKDYGFGVAIDLELSEIQIESHGSYPSKSAIQIITDVVGEVDVAINGQTLAIMPDIHVRDILNDDDEVMVIMGKKRENIKFVGPTKKVQAMALRLNMEKEMLGHKDSVTVFSDILADSETISLSETCLGYIKKHRWEEISKLNNTYQYLYVHEIENDNRFDVVVEGPIEAVQSASACIKDIVRQLKTTQFRLQSRFGGEKAVPDLSPTMEEAHKCVVKLIPYNPTNASIKYLENEKKTRVHVQLGEMQKIEANVIVNTTNKKLDLQVGWGLSAALVKAGGIEIEKELKLKYQDGIDYGEVAVSGPGKLTNCKAIYHGALPPFSREDNTSYEKLVLFMINCLERANSACHKSIAFPGLGTGTLQYPLQNVVQLMHQTVRRFLQSTASLSLEEIIFVIYPSANALINQSFIRENLSTRLKSLKIENIESLHEELQTPERICCEARLPVGKSCIQVFNSDVKFVCDVTKNVLVLWRRNDLAENTCKGNPFLAHVAPFVSEHFNKGLVFKTKDAKCVVDRETVPEYTLIHSVYVDDNEKNVVDAIDRGFKMAKKENIHSLTLPLLNDGSRTWYPSNAASIVMEAAKKSSSSQTCISVAIPDGGTFRDFVTMAMEKNGRNIHVQQPTHEIVESVWSSQKSIIPGDTVLFVTSDSEGMNQNVAEEFARHLQMAIVYTVYDCNYITQ